MRAKRALVEFRAGGESAAEQRAWELVSATWAKRRPRRRYRVHLAALAAPIVAAAVATLTLTPAGASVRRWISHALGVQHAAPALFSLPTQGRVLAAGRGGAWIVAEDGLRQSLGDWRHASWSPHGLYVVVSAPDELATVNTRGAVQWALSRPGVSDPRWYSPTGYRIAYLSGHQLRVVAGDGTGDHLLDDNAGQVAPAWRPGHPYQLAYITRSGRLVVRNGDTGQLIWSAAAKGTRTLTWSSNGDELLALSPLSATLYGGGGRPIATYTSAHSAPFVDAGVSPDGNTLALIAGSDPSKVLLIALDSAHPAPRQIFSGARLRQLAFSPEGRWLLVSWPAADQWVFIKITGRPRIAATSAIAQQLSRRHAARGFPQLDGWCCTAAGTAG